MAQTVALAPGEVRTRAQLQPLFGGNPFAGICLAAAEQNILLYSDPASGAEFGYADGWIQGRDPQDLLYEYTGAGQQGDQGFSGPVGRLNGAVLNHQTTGRTLHVFKAVGTVPGTNTRTHCYLGAFALDEDEPYALRQAPDLNKHMRLAIVFRLRPVGPYLFDRADLVTSSAEAPVMVIPSELITVTKVVNPERNTRRHGHRSHIPASTFERREADLSDRLEAYLKDQGHAVGRLQIKVKGTTTLLVTDLYDQNTHVLFEVKGSDCREHVRMALGQLFDYRHHITGGGFPGQPRIVVVLPRQPEPDLVEMLHEVNVGLAYPSGDSFVGVPV